MKQQKDYKFFQKQVILMVWLSVVPGLVYVFFGYLFDVLNSLEDEKLIKQFYQSKALVMLPEGIKRAKELQSKYL